jgi:hypothetical protein
VYEIENGGRLFFTMRGPDSVNDPNESAFTDIESPTEVEVQHVSEPKFGLTIALAASAVGTVVS